MKKPIAVLVLALGLFGSSGSADALPKVGELPPSARATDADGRTLDLRSVKDRPILIVYEDKDSATLNSALKTELAQRARGERYRRSVTLVPVANLSGYDYWPVRGFVKDAIRDESRKIGATIYCDWDGGFRRSLNLAPNTSSVVLIGRGGKVLFAAEGLIPKAERDRLFDLLKNEVEGQS